MLPDELWVKVDLQCVSGGKEEESAMEEMGLSPRDARRWPVRDSR